MYYFWFMIEFPTIILQFKDQSQKTDWICIEILADIAQDLKPGNKKSLRVKGELDQYAFSSLASMPKEIL